MGNSNKTKKLNTSRIIREIWLAKNISRIEISNKLNLNKSTVTHIVRELIERNMVTLAELGDPGPKGGRKPVMLTLNRKFGYVLGFELRPDGYTVVAVDLEGEILFSRSQKILISQESFTSTFFEILKRVSENQKTLGIPLMGIGLGVSGIVDPDKGRIMSSIPLSFTDPYDVSSELEPSLEVPIFVENDANCCAWGELVFHRDSFLNHFIFVLVEFRNARDVKEGQELISVGLGLVINGKVHYGDGYYAGEFRSLLSSIPGKQFSLSKEDLTHLDNDEALMGRFFVELAQNIALLANVFNLSQVFLGGDIEKYKDRISSIMEKEVRDNWPYDFPVDRRILFSTLGDQAVAFGAAGMVLNRILVDFDVEKGPETSFLPEGL